MLSRTRAKKFCRFFVGGPDGAATLPPVHMCRAPPAACRRLSLAVYLSIFFCNCVSDPDVSINKRGLPVHNQSQAMFMFGLVLPTASAAQVESRCATKISGICLMDQRGL